MSIAADFQRAFTRLTKGAGATHARAGTTFNQLQKFCASQKWQGVGPQTISPKQVRLFAEHRLSEGISVRSVQNEISHIRRSVAGCGRVLGDIRKMDNSWSNRRCSVPSASRKSQKLPCSIEKYTNTLKICQQGMAIVLELERELGLRAQEAVKAVNLIEWNKQIESHVLGRALYLHLTPDAGSKGGRARDIYIHPNKFEVVQRVVNDAVAYKREHGMLIEKDNLRAAMKSYGYHMTKHEMTGNNSGHGLRRLWATEQYALYRADGLSREQALSRLSCDLGHGDGRGTWVLNNYLCGKA